MPTNAEILALAPSAGYLAANATRGNTLFRRGARLNPILTRQIYALYFVIKKIYDNNPNYAGMDAACNYLWEIMGRYGIAAQANNGGGGSISPITPPENEPSPYYFIVSDSTLLANGDSTVQIPEFARYNVIFTRGGVPQSNVDTEDSYFTWDATTTILTCFPAVVTGELIGIIPV